MKIRWLNRRIGRAGPYLALCLSSDEFHKELRRLKVPNLPTWVGAGADATTHKMENGNGKLCCLVCLKGHESKSSIEVAGLLIHEAVHVWQAWCDDCGEFAPGHEQEAYAIQSISQELLAEYARRMI